MNITIKWDNKFYNLINYILRLFGYKVLCVDNQHKEDTFAYLPDSQ